MTNTVITHQLVEKDRLLAALSGAALCEPYTQAPVLLGTPSYLINLTFNRPELKLFQPGDLAEDRLTGTFGGHLFGPSMELRWLQNGESFDVWTLRDTDHPTASEGVTVLENVSTISLNFYCLGTWNPLAGEFRDGRVSAGLQYNGVQNGSSERHRLFFTAVAYSPSEGAHGAGLQQATDKLNQPRVVAYRLTGLNRDAGKSGF